MSQFVWFWALIVALPLHAIPTKKATLLDNGKEYRIKVHVVETDEDRARGLMFVRSLPEDEGMLFIFPVEQPLSFWMKNTQINLSIGFFDNKGRLFQMEEMSTKDPIKTTKSQLPGKFALEMNQGWFKKRKINLGAQLRLQE